MEKASSSKLTVPVTGEAAPDNKNALEVDLSVVDLKKFGLPKQSKYYVWSKSIPKGGGKFIGDDGKEEEVKAPKNARSLGNLIRKTGDPFTYQTEGEKYRVVSGPSLSGTYQSGRLKGKKIGTRPIGALISLSKEPIPIPVTPDPETPEAELNEDSKYRYLRYIDARTKSLLEQGQKFQKLFKKFQSDWENKILKAKLQIQPDDGFFDKLAKSGEGVASMTQERKDALSNWKKVYAPGGSLEKQIEAFVSAADGIKKKYEGAYTSDNSPAANNFYLVDLVEESKTRLSGLFTSLVNIRKTLKGDADKVKKGSTASAPGHAKVYDKGVYKQFEELMFTLDNGKSVEALKKAVTGNNANPTGTSIGQGALSVAYIINSANKREYSIDQMMDYIERTSGSGNMREGLSRGSLYRRRYRRY